MKFKHINTLVWLIVMIPNMVFSYYDLSLDWENNTQWLVQYPELTNWDYTATVPISGHGIATYTVNSAEIGLKSSNLPLEKRGLKKFSIEVVQDQLTGSCPANCLCLRTPTLLSVLDENGYPLEGEITSVTWLEGTIQHTRWTFEFVSIDSREAFDKLSFKIENPYVQFDYGNGAYYHGTFWGIKSVSISVVSFLPSPPVITDLLFTGGATSGDAIPLNLTLKGKRDISDPETIHKNFKLSYTLVHTPVSGQKQKDTTGEFIFTLDIPDDQADFNTTFQLPFAPNRTWPEGQYRLTGTLFDDEDVRVAPSGDKPVSYTLNKPAPSIQSAALKYNEGKVITFDLNWTPRYNSGDLLYDAATETFTAMPSKYRYKLTMGLRDNAAILPEASSYYNITETLFPQNNVSRLNTLTLAENDLLIGFVKTSHPGEVALCSVYVASTEAGNWSGPYYIGEFKYTKLSLGNSASITQTSTWPPVITANINATNECAIECRWNRSGEWTTLVSKVSAQKDTSITILIPTEVDLIGNTSTQLTPSPFLEVRGINVDVDTSVVLPKTITINWPSASIIDKSTPEDLKWKSVFPTSVNIEVNNSSYVTATGTIVYDSVKIYGRYNTPFIAADFENMTVLDSIKNYGAHPKTIDLRSIILQTVNILTSLNC
jgi:hypothetical protein